jgi:hypothetical protein
VRRRLLGLTDLKALEHGIAKDAFKALSGDDKATCRDLAKRNSAGLKQLGKDLKGLQQGLRFNPQPAALEALRAIEAMPAESAEEVAAKEAAYHAVLSSASHSPLALAADLAVGAFLLPKTPDTLTHVPTTESLHAVLTGAATTHDPDSAHAPACQAARDACRVARVFHWPLAFPQVFAQGGFDCVLANPPWERIKLQEEEFFATRHTAVAEARNKAERARRIQWLSEGLLAQHLYPGDAMHHTPAESDSEKRLFAEFITARRTAEAASVFAHVDGADGGRYRLTGVGDVNTYALFAETILQIHAEQGRAGFLVPTGIATDDTTKGYFSHIAQSGRLVSLLAYENEEFIFRDVHHAFRFCMVTLGASPTAKFAFFARQPEQVHDRRRQFELTSNEFRLLNPNTLTCPIFRSARDAELTKKLYRTAPVLVREGAGADGNPWGISFMRMFDMANDSHLFLDAPGTGRLPLYEAKLIHHFDHRWATYRPDGETREFTPDEKRAPTTTIAPRYWVPQRAVWLRVSTLPEGLRKALEHQYEIGVVLGVTQLLFGWLLADRRRQGVYLSWQEFVAEHPYAQRVAPTSLGLCGDNPPCLQPPDDDYLPAEGSFEVFMSNERTSSAWYAIDPTALDMVLGWTGRHRGRLPQPERALESADDVLALADVWLESSCPKWLMGWRDVCRATDERTVIASALPLVAVNHKTPLWFAAKASTPALDAALLGNFAALVLDYIARQKVGGSSMSYFHIKQLPVLPPDRYTKVDQLFIAPRVLELTYTAHDMAPWAQALGHDGPPFGFDPERRAMLRAELDARYARLYGLTRDELRYILDPADVAGADYPTETFRVLKASELREFGEYRTRRLVLEAWDRQHKTENGPIAELRPSGAADDQEESV